MIANYIGLQFDGQISSFKDGLGFFILIPNTILRLIPQKELAKIPKKVGNSRTGLLHISRVPKDILQSNNKQPLKNLNVCISAITEKGFNLRIANKSDEAYTAYQHLQEEISLLQKQKEDEQDRLLILDILKERTRSSFSLSTDHQDLSHQSYRPYAEDIKRLATIHSKLTLLKSDEQVDLEYLRLLYLEAKDIYTRRSHS